MAHFEPLFGKKLAIHKMVKITLKHGEINNKHVGLTPRAVPVREEDDLTEFFGQKCYRII